MRLAESRIRMAAMFGCCPAASWLLGELHVGFVFVAETEEQLARLRGEPAGKPGKPARSKIGKTNLKDIEPIDAVAARVVPTDNQAEELPS